MKNILMLPLILILVSCTRIYKAEVWFDEAATDLKANTPVMIGAQVIGRTAVPAVVSGRLKVPILLNTADALPDATIFLVEQDARGVRMTAKPRGKPLHLSGASFEFRGAATTVEYWRMAVGDKLEELTR